MYFAVVLRCTVLCRKKSEILNSELNHAIRNGIRASLGMVGIGEKPNMMMLIGGAIVLSALVVFIVFERRINDLKSA